MRFSKDIEVGRPPEAVWGFLWDVERVATCLPGCREVRTIVTHERYAAVVGERVGPLTVQSPLEIQVLAMGSTLRVVLDLNSEPHDNGCVIRVSSETLVLGKLATLGQGIIQRKAVQIMEQFASALRHALESAS